MAEYTQFVQSEVNIRPSVGVLDGLHDGFMAVDHQWRLTYLNPAAVRMLNPSREPGLGAYVWDVLPEALDTRLPEATREALADHRLVELDEYFPLLGRWFTFRCHPSDDGLSVLFSDVTERQTAARLHARLAAIVEGSDDAIIGKTVDGTVTSWNPGAERLYGYSATEVIGKSIAIIVPDDRREELAGIIELISQGRRINHFETVRRHRLGRLIEVSLTASPIFDLSGEIIGASAIARDISARKTAETKLLKSETRLRVITDSVPVMIGYVNRYERYQFVNLMYEKWFARSRDELCGCTVKEVVGEQAYKTVASRIAAALAGKRQTFEMKLPRRGEDRDVQVQYVPHRSSESRSYGVFVVVTDVTRLKRAEVEAAMLAASDSERQRIGRELHDTVVQELAGSAMMAESLRQRLATQPCFAETAEQIVEVLKEAQVQARRLSHGLIPVEVDVAGLMNALEELAEQTARMHGIDCRFQCQRDVWVESNAMATHLYRIAQEATHNAVKHARANLIRLALKGQRVVRLSIKDDGIGIPANRLNGAGSGLRIMRYRAESIGGKLKIEPSIGNGTTVVCTLRQKGNVQR